MAASYPKQKTGTASTRPSASVSRILAAANDTTWGNDGNKKARPLNIRNMTNPFHGPKISYGRPAPSAIGAVTRPDRLGKTALAGMGRFAVRATPYLALADFALDNLPFFTHTLWEGTGTTVRRPLPGFWRKTSGDFYYTSPYHNSQALGFAQATYHKPITGQAISGFYGLNNPVPAHWNTLGLWRANRTWGQSVPVTRYAHHSSWVRISSAIGAGNVTWAFPAPRAAIPAFIDPLSVPVGAKPNLRPPPYSILPLIGHNPYRSPIEQTQRGNAVPAAAAAVAGDAGFGWGGAGGWATVIGVGRPVGVYQRPAERPRPPKKGEKEKKIFVSGSRVPVIGLVTEGLDAIEQIWKALPKEARTGYYKLHYRDKETGEIKTYYKYRHKASATDKMRDLIKNWHKVDAVQAGSNLIDNAIEDRIYGGIGQVTSKARRKASQFRDGKGNFHDLGPKGRGYQTGGWDSPWDFGEKPHGKGFHWN